MLEAEFLEEQASKLNIRWNIIKVRVVRIII